MTNSKTRVNKWMGRWWVHYYMPYSGMVMSGGFKTWEDAMREAEGVVRQKEWL
jgi:hypothetical protein